MAQNGYVQLSAFPSATVADNHSQIVITAVATDTHGSPVPDGTQVEFTSDLGTFQQAIVTTKNGYAHGTLVAGGIAGTATVTVKVLGYSIPASTYPIRLAANREDLAQLNNYYKLKASGGIEYDPRTQLLQLQSTSSPAEVSGSGVTILADSIQVNGQSLEVRAHRAVLVMNGKSQKFSELQYNLSSQRGYGLGSFKTLAVKGLSVGAHGLTVASKVAVDEDELYGMVDITGAKAEGSTMRYQEAFFKQADFSELPFVFGANSAILVPHQEIDFQHFRYMVGGAKTFSTALYRVSLNGGALSGSSQVLSIRDNQVAISYPYFMSLSPNQSSVLRFHIGDAATSGFGAGNGPQMDYEVDWKQGSNSSGGFLLNGIGTKNWGVGFHQFKQLDSKSSIYAQIQAPQLKSLFGNLSGNRQIGSFNLSASSSYNQTLTGIKQTDQSQTLNLLHNPIPVGKLPVNFSYGLSMSRQSTTLPVAIQSQTAYGLTSNFDLHPQRLDRQTTLNSSLRLSELQGQNVGSGFSLNFLTSLSRAINRDFSVFLTYAFTQDPFTASQYGRQRISGNLNYSHGGGYFNFSTGTSIGFNNYNASAIGGYRFARAWRFETSYSVDRYAGFNFIDYGATLFFRINQEEFGLTWSKYTGRFGIVFLGVPVY